jgi:predicted transcriptional regulator
MLIQKNSLRSKTHRDKSYIIKDLISALVKSGEINQTLLATFCGINITKHRKILVDLETNELISKHEEKISKEEYLKRKKEFLDIEYSPRKCKVCGSKEFEFISDNKNDPDPSDIGYYTCKICGKKENE